MNPQAEATFSCTAVTVNFTGFPAAPGNVATENVFVDGKVVKTVQVVFTGPTFSNTINVAVPPGSHKMDVLVKWKTSEGAKGGRDINGGLHTCEADPEFSILKLQRIGEKTKFVTTLLAGKVGQMVEYAIQVTNTGNVPLSFEPLNDPKCDEGTITGGPSGPLAPGEKATYRCAHVLTVADDQVGFYTNTATSTATDEFGPPITHESNTVVVELPTPGGHVSKFGCESITFVYEGFPNFPNNTVTEIVRDNGVVIVKKTFTFNGPSAEDTIPLSLGPGKHHVDGLAKWNTHGFKGGFDETTKAFECP